MCHSQFGTEDEPITVNHLETPTLVVTSHNWLKRAVFSWVATLQRDFCEAPGKFPLSQVGENTKTSEQLDCSSPWTEPTQDSPGLTCAL